MFPIDTKVRVQISNINVWNNVVTISKILPSSKSYLTANQSGSQSVVRNYLPFVNAAAKFLHHNTTSTLQDILCLWHDCP